MDEALANALLVLGCPPRFRRVAPSRRRLEASRAGGPVQTQEPHHDPMTRADDPRQAVAAARPSDPGSLWHRRRWTGQVRRLGARPTQPGPDPLVPAPWTRRTPLPSPLSRARGGVGGGRDPLGPHPATRPRPGAGLEPGLPRHVPGVLTTGRPHRGGARRPGAGPAQVPRTRHAPPRPALEPGV